MGVNAKCHNQKYSAFCIISREDQSVVSMIAEVQSIKRFVAGWLANAAGILEATEW